MQILTPASLASGPKKKKKKKVDTLVSVIQ